MIRAFRHKGLRKLFEEGSPRGVLPTHVKRLQFILQLLDGAVEPRDMNAPGLRLHQLHGEHEGAYSVSVSANWRVVFRFEGRDVTDVDYGDYH